MNEINELIAQYGNLFYIITFVWAALEGETFVIFAGFAAQRGILNLELLCLSAWLGSFVGDQAFFWAGRHFGKRILERFPKLQKGVDVASLWLKKYAVWFILSYRFMYGVRNVSSIAIGMSDFKWQKFAFWNAVAALIWAISFAGFGYFFGDVVTRVSSNGEDMNSNVHEISIALAILLLLIIGFKFAMKKIEHWKN